MKRTSSPSCYRPLFWDHDRDRISWVEQILEPKQHEALRLLAPIATEERFALGGGAAVGLYAGHRKTIDLDFFTREKFTVPAVSPRDSSRPDWALKRARWPVARSTELSTGSR